MAALMEWWLRWLLWNDGCGCNSGMIVVKRWKWKKGENAMILDAINVRVYADDKRVWYENR